MFLDQSWLNFGTRSSLSLEITRATGISSEHLVSFQGASIAQKMSWASRRRTTRIEDVAYCLLGLFNVNMPLLYGEGDKAFLRLQQEIISSSDDETIFAWKLQGSFHGPHLTGLLAASPADFKFSGDVIPFIFDSERPHYFETNKGLRLGPLCIQVHRQDGWNHMAKRLNLGIWIDSHNILIPLNCQATSIRAGRDSRESPGIIVLILAKHRDQSYVRIHPQRPRRLETGNGRCHIPQDTNIEDSLGAFPGRGDAITLTDVIVEIQAHEFFHLHQRDVFSYERLHFYAIKPMERPDADQASNGHNVVVK